MGRLGVVTIATPNAGALTLGQMSLAAGLVGNMLVETASLLHGAHNLHDLTTPKLFLEFERWRVSARYLSISACCVNRYGRRWSDLLAKSWFERVAFRLDVPNDLIVEDSSVDLGQSLIRPEVDLSVNYRHVRAYPKSIELSHWNVKDSETVGRVISGNLKWLVCAPS